MATRKDLESMTNKEIAKEFGITGRAALGSKASLIALALGEDKPDKAKDTKSATMPRIEVRAVDKGISLIYTPLGKGLWRVETTADGGTGEVDGGIDATWDGTTLVLGNAYQDQWGHFTFFTPLMAPVMEEGDDEGT